MTTNVITQNILHVESIHAALYRAVWLVVEMAPLGVACPAHLLHEPRNRQPDYEEPSGVGSSSNFAVAARPGPHAGSVDEDSVDALSPHTHQKLAIQISTIATGLAGVLALFLNFASPALYALDASDSAYTLGLVSRFLLYSSLVNALVCATAATCVLRWGLYACVGVLVVAVLEGLGGVMVFIMTMGDEALSIAVIGQMGVCGLVVGVYAMSKCGRFKEWMVNASRFFRR